jgi:tRNA-binding EMAP/Myf-like protein
MGEVNIAISNLPEGTRVESALYNSSGMLLSASPLSGTGSGAINLTAQPSGIYYLKLKAGDKRSVWKIVKE